MKKKLSAKEREMGKAELERRLKLLMQTPAVDKENDEDEEDYVHKENYLTEEPEMAEIPDDNEESDNEVPFSTVRCDQWLLIRFSVGRANKSVHYVGQVVDRVKKDKIVSFLRKAKEPDCFIWPKKKDKLLIKCR